MIDPNDCPHRRRIKFAQRLGCLDCNRWLSGVRLLGADDAAAGPSPDTTPQPLIAEVERLRAAIAEARQTLRAAGLVDEHLSPVELIREMAARCVRKAEAPR